MLVLLFYFLFYHSLGLRSSKYAHVDARHVRWAPQRRIMSWRPQPHAPALSEIVCTSSSSSPTIVGHVHGPIQKKSYSPHARWQRSQSSSVQAKCNVVHSLSRSGLFRLKVHPSLVLLRFKP